MQPEIREINARIQDLKARDISAKEITDGHHSFEELYYHRMVLFSLLCRQFAGHGWKSWKHHDGTMFGGSFIVGLSTPAGQYTYHYNAEHWDQFPVKVLDFAPEYDGHKPSDIGRLTSLNFTNPGKRIE